MQKRMRIGKSSQLDSNMMLFGELEHYFFYFLSGVFRTRYSDAVDLRIYEQLVVVSSFFRPIAKEEDLLDAVLAEML